MVYWLSLLRFQGAAATVTGERAKGFERTAKDTPADANG